MKLLLTALIVGIAFVAMIAFTDIIEQGCCEDIDPYYSNPLYCESSSDCRAQLTCQCECPHPVNKYHYDDSPDCELISEEYRLICDIYCPANMPLCSDNTCMLVASVLHE